MNRLYEIDREQINVESYSEGQVSKVGWTDNNDDYFARFSSIGQLMNIEVHWDREQPTLGQVVDCLGPPDYYIANGGPRTEAAHLQLWYVEQGFVAFGYVVHSGLAILWQEPLKVIPPGFAMSAFRILPAGLEQMTRRFDYTDEDGDPIMCIFKPWPSSIEAIQLGEGPFLACPFSPMPTDVVHSARRKRHKRPLHNQHGVLIRQRQHRRSRSLASQNGIQEKKE